MGIMPNKRSWQRPFIHVNSRFKISYLPFRYKLIAIFLLASIIPTFLLGGLINWTVNNIIENQVNGNTLQLIDKVNKTIENYFTDMQNNTYLIGFDPYVSQFLDNTQEGTPGLGAEGRYRIRTFLQGITTLHSEIAGILLVNNQGDYISNELYAKSAGNLVREPWYKEAAANNGIFKLLGHPRSWGIANHSNYKDSELISAARAIVDPDTREVKGVVLIDLKLRVIAEAIKDVRLGKSGYLMVLDEGGDIIYAPARSLAGFMRMEWFGKGQSGVTSQTVDNTHVQLIYEKSLFTGWTTVGVFPSHETAVEMQEIRFYLVCFVFFVCMVGLGASSYLSYSITRPIWMLMKLMQKAELGDLTIRYTGKHQDEIGILGRAFNTMMARIHSLMQEVSRKEKQKREAELRSLQAQIKPHFLYNTLDTIHWLAHQRGAAEASEMVESLSKLFRIGLSKGQEMIGLDQELEHVRSYMNIQKTRYQSKLNDAFHIDPAAEGLYVLKLITQPLVENAIYHGIKERRGPGIIHISAVIERNLLLIEVRDDGMGIKPEKLQELKERLARVADNVLKEAENHLVDQSDGGEAAVSVEQMISGSGYGLLNVHSRLVLTFGRGFGLDISSEWGKGTVVTVTHPVINSNMEEPDHGKMEGSAGG